MRYVIDIDGTICIEEGPVEKRIPIPERISYINRLYEEGHYIVYWTARGLKSGKGEKYYRPITEKQLKEFGCKYHELGFKSHDADIFIDDKAINDKDFFK